MRFSKRVAAATLVALLGLMTMLLPAGAGTALDQFNNLLPQSGTTILGAEPHQTFTPTYGNVSKIRVYLLPFDTGVGLPNDAEITLTLYTEGGAVIGAATVSRGAGFAGGWVDFVFGAPIPVTPGVAYVIGLDAGLDGNDIYWGYLEGDPYAGGAASTGLFFQFVQTYDFLFETYYDDSTPPAISYALNVPQQPNNWYNTPEGVSLAWTVSEPESPGTLILTGCVNQSITVDQAITAYNCSASSLGGPSVPPTVTVSIGLDRVKPVIEVLSRTPAINGWNNEDVIITFQCTDGLSGVATDTVPDITVTSEGAAQWRTTGGQCIDNAGNSADPLTFNDINIDKTPPTITAAATSSPNAAGWYNTDVTVRFTCGDDRSGIPSNTCPADQILNGEGPAVTSTAMTVMDAAGNPSAPSNVVTVMIDKTAPNVTLSVLQGPPNSAGWYKTDVVVHTEGDDPGIGASEGLVCTPDQPFSAETAGFNVEGSCTDAAGNIGHAAPLTLKIDKTAPATTLTTTPPEPNGANGWFTSDVTVHADVTDSLSGPGTCDPDEEVDTETTGTTVSLSCTDVAGNSSSASMLIKLDKSDPTGSMVVVFGTEGLNGWYTTGVVVAATGSDSISGPVVCTPALQPLGIETQGTTLTALCTNQAGRTFSPELEVKIDKTPPATTIAASAPPDGTNGWYVTNPTLFTTGLDPTSNPVTCTDPQVTSTETAGLVVTGTCTNDAGLSSSDSETIKLDKTGPTDVQLAVVSGTLGDNGWYTTDIVVRTTGTDNISGPVTCTPDQPWTTEADDPGHEFTGACTNLAGLTTDADPLFVKVDKTAPADVVITPAGTLGDNGWYVSDVILTTTGVEDVSDPMVCTPAQTLSTDTTGLAFNGSCENEAGLVGTATPVTVKRDATPPALFVTMSAAVELNAVVTATPNATDATSGVASATCDPVDTSTTGTHNVTCTAEDNAGNVTTVTVEYQVLDTTPGSGDCGEILFGTLPPAGGGYGTFAFSCGTLEQLLQASGCPHATATFFYNAPGTFIVWIPGTNVSVVNDAFLATFNGDPPIPVNTIFTAKCR